MTGVIILTIKLAPFEAKIDTTGRCPIKTATWIAVHPPNPGWFISSGDIFSMRNATISTSPL